MTTNRYPDAFLFDLARLLRHGSEPLDAIINEISNADTRAHLIRKLITLSDLSKEMARHKKPQQAASERRHSLERLEEVLRTLHDKDAKRYEILTQMRQRLRDKASVIDRKSLAQLGEKLGMHFGAKLPRVEIIDRIIVRLVDYEAFDQGLRDVANLDRGSPGEYMKLAEFITGSSRPQEPQD